VRGYNYPTSHSQSVTHITTDGRTVLPLCRCPGAGGAYDSHHRTAGIAGRSWRCGSGRVAARSARSRRRCRSSTSSAAGRPKTPSSSQKPDRNPAVQQSPAYRSVQSFRKLSEARAARGSAGNIRHVCVLTAVSAQTILMLQFVTAGLEAVTMTLVNTRRTGRACA
jgi:hypothetical protein